MSDVDEIAREYREACAEERRALAERDAAVNAWEEARKRVEAADHALVDANNARMRARGRLLVAVEGASDGGVDAIRFRRREHGEEA